MEFTDNLKKVVILGIGGKASFYVARFLNLAGIELVGYDLQKSERTEDLEKLGVKINYRNPEKGESFDSDMFLYSNDLPQALQKQVKDDNRDIKAVEIGAFYREIIESFKNEDMSKEEIEAFRKSNIGPLFDVDQNKMRYIAVTGTDGKTTTCTMIYHLLKEAGFKPALITTVAAYIADEQIDTGLHTTTPSSQDMYDLIKKTEEKNCTHIIIETTSHGLQQARLAGLKMDSVGYTNITPEHLDYHGNWESYLDAKALLVKEYLKEGGNAVLNLDDESFRHLSQFVSKPITYSLKKEADLQASDIEEQDSGVSFNLLYKDKKYKGKLPILGKCNVSNFLCALAICQKEGLELEEMLDLIKSFKTISGRMEVFQRKPFYVIIDHAHTSNSIKMALESTRSLLHRDGKVIHVFGCAGHRDFYKREEMGKVSNELSDISILTAEDPRFEDLKSINDQIEEGWRKGSNRNGELYRFDYTDRDVEVRRDAIVKAFEIAKEGDAILLTGKAHEQSLCFGQTEYPWSEAEEVKALLSRE